jgi:OOP family OmpA-OmpF porin
MKYLILGCLLLTSTSSWSKTFDFADRFGIGGGGGWAFPIQGNGFDDLADDELMWNVHARYNLTPQDGLQLNYSMFEFENTDINARVMDLMYIYRINEGDKLTPILGIGAGVADMGNIKPFHDGLKFAARARAGFEYALTDDFLASAFVDYQYIGKMPNSGESEEDNDEGIPGQEVFALVPQVGLTYFFGPDKEVENKKPAPQPAAAAAPAAIVVSNAMMDDDKDGIVNAKDKCPGTEPGKVVNAYGCMPKETATMTVEVLFSTGAAKLGSEAYPHLNELAAFMNEHPETKIEIQGHTDNTGSKKRNKELSNERANAIRTYLVEQAGIPASRVSAYGYGDEKPVAPNTTRDGRAENRRVVAVITQ